MIHYVQYKGTDQLWLPSIPSHWDMKRVKYLFDERVEKGFPDEALLVSSQSMGVVPKDVYASRTVVAQKDLHLLKLVRKGDFVISLRSFQGGIEFAYYQGIISPAYTIMINKGEINSEYFKYLAKSKSFISLLQMCVTGIREGQNIDYNRLKNQSIPIPTYVEQGQIVRFLDWKISTINNLINIKRRKIRMYEDWKACEIHSVVTSGLTKDVLKTETGITWIPEIPKHWDMRRIKFLFDMRDERNYQPLSDVNLISLYTRLGVVQNKDVEYTTGNRARNADGYKIVHKNDIIVNIILCWMGAIGMSNYDGVTSPAYDIYIPKEGIHSRYYHYLFRTKAFSGECYKAGKGIMAMRWRTYSPQFRNISVPLPPLEEQIEIAAYLDERCATIDRQIEITQQQIQQLRELKDRLIADAVTGKIDVRNIQIPDYEYVDEEPDAVDSDEEAEEQEGEE